MSIPQEARTIEAFERAVIEYTWRGGGHPEDEPRIILHYHRTKAKMYELLGLKYTIPEEDDE